MILITFFLSLTGRFPAHRRLARFTFSIWLYVSVTGVIVYAMLASYR
jgi:putative membrane protein